MREPKFNPPNENWVFWGMGEDDTNAIIKRCEELGVKCYYHIPFFSTLIHIYHTKDEKKLTFDNDNPFSDFLVLNFYDYDWRGYFDYGDINNKFVFLIKGRNKGKHLAQIFKTDNTPFAEGEKELFMDNFVKAFSECFNHKEIEIIYEDEDSIDIAFTKDKIIRKLLNEEK